MFSPEHDALPTTGWTLQPFHIGQSSVTQADH